MSIKIITKNRKAYHEYEVGEKFEAGLELKGTEVKALRIGKVNINDGWVDITSQGEAILVDTTIGHYTHGNLFNHEETRPRRLLLHKNEIAKLLRGVSERGYSIIPLAVYFKGRYIKMEISLARGKKAYDKRQSEKTKDANREISRAIRHKNRGE